MVDWSIELGPGSDRAYGMNLTLAELVLGLLGACAWRGVRAQPGPISLTRLTPKCRVW
jgi:hypothetical protein